jgi:hypothetical protein
MANLDSINELQQSLNSIREPFSNIKQQIADLKQPFSNMKRQITELMQPFSDMSRQVSEIMKPISTTMAMTDLSQHLLSVTRDMSTLKEWNRIIADFDWSSISVNNGSIIYSGIEYSPEDIEQELLTETAILKTVRKKKSLKKLYEECKEKLWLVLFLLSLIISIPEIFQGIEWFSDKFENVFVEFNQTEDAFEFIVYTVVESTPLRAEPNGKGKIEKRLRIETELRIISDIPRWYEVEYTLEDGTKIIGWVSKRSVEISE